MSPDAELVARAAQLRSLLERNAETTDALRRLPDDIVEALRGTGLCRLMVPARFGGCQTRNAKLSAIAQVRSAKFKVK